MHGQTTPKLNTALLVEKLLNFFHDAQTHEYEEIYIYICNLIFIYLLQLRCYPVAVVILHVNKT